MRSSFTLNLPVIFLVGLTALAVASLVVVALGV
jgi:hypothetical protein